MLVWLAVLVDPGSSSSFVMCCVIGSAVDVDVGGSWGPACNFVIVTMALFGNMVGWPWLLV